MNYDVVLMVGLVYLNVIHHPLLVQSTFPLQFQCHDHDQQHHEECDKTGGIFCFASFDMLSFRFENNTKYLLLLIKKKREEELKNTKV